MDTPITLACGILCTLQRYKMAVALRHKLNEVGAQPVIYCDTQREGVWPSTRKLMVQLIQQKADYLILCQEDILPCDKFMQRIRQVINAIPDKIISLYHPRAWKDRTEYAIKHGESWITSHNHPGSPCMIFPHQTAVEFLLWESQHIDDGVKYEEPRLWAFINSCGDGLFYSTRPALVQHLGAEVSSLGFNHKGKITDDFIDDLPSPEIDWTRMASKIWPENHEQDKYFTPLTFRGTLHVQ